MTDSTKSFTQRAQQVLNLAKEEAERRGNLVIETEHLLYALLNQQGGVARNVLEELNISRERVEAILATLPLRHIGGVREEIEHSPHVNRTIELATNESDRMNNHHVGTEHLLLGLVRYYYLSKSNVLAQLGTDDARVRRQVRYVVRPVTPSIVEGSIFFTEPIIALSMSEIEKFFNLIEAGELTTLEAKELLRQSTPPADITTRVILKLMEDLASTWPSTGHLHIRVNGSASEGIDWSLQEASMGLLKLLKMIAVGQKSRIVFENGLSIDIETDEDNP
jgi:hypothetical protein